MIFILVLIALCMLALGIVIWQLLNELLLRVLALEGRMEEVPPAVR